MEFFRSTARLLPVGLAISLLFLATFASVVVAQEPDPEPLVGPSGLIDGDGAGVSSVEAAGGAVAAEPGQDVQLGGTNEPTIAVNPRNPANVVMASLFRLRVSTDNGANFSAPTLAPVPATHSRAGDPSLAFDSQGRLFWTYLGRRRDNGLIDVLVSGVNPTTGKSGLPPTGSSEAPSRIGSTSFGHDSQALPVHVPDRRPCTRRLLRTKARHGQQL